MSSGLRQRVITAICIGIPILFLVFYSDTTRVSFLLLVGVLASHEYLKLFYPKLIKSPSGLISFLISVGLLFYSTQQLDIFFIPLLAVSIFSSVVLLYDLFYNESSIQEKMPALWNILYVVLPLVLIINLNHESNFSMILISTLLMIWISDISAYFVGRTIGKRKLFPRVSPGKTWEGFWGAGLITVLFSYAFFSYFGIYDVRQWALIAISVWLFGSLGDLVESKFKRSLNIKDSGNIMPGHGGILDRFDAFIFCLPFVVSLSLVFN